MTPGARQEAGAIELRDVRVDLGGAPVLRDVSLRIEPGEQVAFLGPSGAGKTTLLRLLNGMVTASAGRVAVGGRDVAGLDSDALRRLRSSVGFVHQDLRLVPNLRAGQNVLSGTLGRRGLLSSLRLFLRPSSTDLDEAHRLLGRVGIADKIFQRTDRLSGGEAQRVAIARALVQRPAILVADEPVASVDPARARDVLELLIDLSRQDGLTLCVSLHDAALAQDLFPRLVGLRAGRIELDASSDRVDPAGLQRLYELEAADGL